MKQKAKTIGIIGGFGPEATAQFYLKLVAKHRWVHNGLQPNIIIRNISVPKNLERNLLVLGKNVDTFAPLLVSAAQQLIHDGADFITLPCNTLHVHENTIRASISKPFVSIVESTRISLKKQNTTRLGFLGSRVTIQNNLFRRNNEKIQFITVKKSLQRQIDKGLEQLVTKQNNTLLMTALAQSFLFFNERGIHDVLIACTDFHDLCPTRSAIRIHDTLDILVQATIDMV